MTVEILVAVLGSSALAEIIKAIVAKRSKKRDRIDALVDAQKVIMIERVEATSRKHIDAGHISIHDKETVTEMYRAYKALGGNGNLEVVMAEIEKLEVVS